MLIFPKESPRDYSLPYLENLYVFLCACPMCFTILGDKSPHPNLR